MTSRLPVPRTRRSVSVSDILAMPPIRDGSFAKRGLRSRMSGQWIYEEVEPAILDKIGKLGRVLEGNGATAERDAASGAIIKLCDRHDLKMEEFGLMQTYDEEQIAAICHYIDADFNAGRTGCCNGWKPSDLLVIGQCILATSYMDKTPGSAALRVAHDRDILREAYFMRVVIERARQLYRDGFYANPFTKEPLRRPAKA